MTLIKLQNSGPHLTQYFADSYVFITAGIVSISFMSIVKRTIVFWCQEKISMFANVKH